MIQSLSHQMEVFEELDVLHEVDYAFESQLALTSLQVDSYPQMIKQFLHITAGINQYPNSQHELFFQYDECRMPLMKQVNSSQLLIHLHSKHIFIVTLKINASTNSIFFFIL